MKERAIELAKEWACNSYIDKADQENINELLADITTNEEELVDRFYQNLEFGTGGLRSIIGVGSNRINKYNVRRATQAMCNTVLAENPTEPKACVSYDNRRFSQDFAKEVASVFAANGIKTFVFSELTPTPMLSYAVRYYKASAGVMVTASHNPKQYNGFKAYWSDGAQVTPPHDQMIIDDYNNLNDWAQVKTVDFEAALHDKMIEWVDSDCTESFYKIIEDHTLNLDMCKKDGDKVHFIYTPLHGCGALPCEIISKRLGFTNFELVQSQAVFDTEFSTLKSTPNPEDPEALELAVALMKEGNADIAYGTDPDCDRLGVVVNDRGIEKYLNGNQIAILMIHYMFSQMTEKGTLPSNPLVIKSIVTSPMQRTIVESFGGTVLDTLTGFKWMAKLWKELEDKNTDFNFVFASEESFGYMPNNLVRDKDAVASIALMNEITLFYKLKGKTLISALDDIYEKFGFAKESLIALSYEGLSGKDKIAKIMQYFRSNPTLPIAGQKAKVFKDFLTQKSINFTSEKEEKIEMTKSNVLGFEFESGHILYLRPSGTEPKIKFYTMVQITDGDLEEKKSNAEKTINEIESFIHNQIKEILE
jgi:phosphoglucomutase